MEQIGSREGVLKQVGIVVSRWREEEVWVGIVSGVEVAGGGCKQVGES